MEQYISLNAIVAEIKRRISLFKKEKKTEKWSAGASQMNVVSLGARIAMLEEIKVFLDTLEVKDVDLEKEITQFLDTYFPDAGIGHKLSLRRTAKYFYELGLKAQKGE